MSNVNHVKAQLWKYQLCYDSDSQAQLCQFQLCKYQLCARQLASLRIGQLFATHYFELTSLPDKVNGAVNVHLDATEFKDTIVFMHSVQDGPASQSYGIQVAKLAGIPEDVIALARSELALLEAASLNSEGTNSNITPSTIPSQNELLLASINPAIQERLESMQPDELSAKQALDLIYELKNLVWRTKKYRSSI